MLDDANSRATAYQVLDQVLAEQAVSAGTRGAMFTVVDSLRSRMAPIEQIRCAENISIEMQRLQLALQRRDNKAKIAALNNLKSLAASWLNTRITGGDSERLRVPRL